MSDLKCGMKRLMAFLLGGMAGIGLCQAVRQKKEQGRQEETVSPLRFEAGFQLLDRWLQMKEAGRSIDQFFLDRHYGKIAIYGMGVLGRHLCVELKETDLHVLYGIDRMAEKEGFGGIPVRSSKDKHYGGIDVIVVTPVQNYWAIEDMLRERTEADIISLEEVLDD